MAAWTMQPATCTHQRLAVVLVSAAFVGGRAVAIGGALASFWRLLLTSPATKTFARNLIRTARPLLSGPFSVVSSPSGFALADPREQPPSRGLNPPHQGAGPRPPQLKSDVGPTLILPCDASGALTCLPRRADRAGGRAHLRTGRCGPQPHHGRRPGLQGVPRLRHREARSQISSPVPAHFLHCSNPR